MATAPECIARFEREAVFVANPERMGRALRQRAPGSWPASPIGGGGASPHVMPKHLTNFLIAQAGFVPSGAASALAALRQLPRFDYDRQPIRGWSDTGPLPREAVLPPPFTNVGEAIESAIEDAADPALRESLKHWALILCPVDPAWVRLEWRRDNYMYVAEFRRLVFSDERRGEHVESVARIPRLALMICGELWADSKAKLAARDDNADPLAGGPAPSKAPTAQQQQDPNSSDATARVRAPATTGGSHARHRRNSTISAASGAT